MYHYPSQITLISQEILRPATGQGPRSSSTSEICFNIVIRVEQLLEFDVLFYSLSIFAQQRYRSEFTNTNTMATPPPQPPPLPYRSSRPARPQQSQLPRSLQSKRIDPSSPAYKQAARKYVSFMVAVPILLVTSYVLFDRLAMGSPTKTLHPEPQQVQPQARPKLEEKQEG